MTKNKFLLLRKQKSLTLEEVSSKIGIAPSSLKKMEEGTRFPAMKSLKKIADFYGVDVSFFTGEAEAMSFAPTITIDTLTTMNGQPIWYFGTKKWYLVNADEQYIVNSTGEKIAFGDIKELYLAKEPAYVKTVTIPKGKKNKPAIPLKRREIILLKKVYVEVISSDEAIAKQLSGIYEVDETKECVKKGDIKFTFLNLNKTWLAFHPDSKS